MTMKPETASKSGNKSLSREAIFFMILLAIQFGVQPGLTRRYTPNDVCKSSVILVAESIKFFLAFSMLFVSGNTKSALGGWTIYSWISVAGVPAVLYAVQNFAALIAYQNLDGLTFNVLNQTKTLSAALCCYLVMGRRQSNMQIVALILLLLSALVLEGIIKMDFFVDHTTASKMELSFDPQHFSHGVAPCLLASFISGLAGALSQKNLQGAGSRNPYLFSMELCAFSVISLGLSLMASPDGQMIREKGFLHGWTPMTLVPIVTNSIGGILVGLVTKYAGAVRKGFGLIFGLFISGLIQGRETGVSPEQITGGLLAGISLWMHATNPAVPTKKTKKD
eukprot:CAMPEP_0194205020 /NCGR_PEP_ID=MMETSP0156-20130528/4377_1 /TAXON_ID=33649 /ORGANISM="Thalassionema nitzschioides, Strain L26-B" /LENGTH=336 /DNA_ID=CAMNT_0038931171 /DNA_START=14 /DNA_END=1024 /DNA_ORIENTATION=+